MSSMMTKSPRIMLQSDMSHMSHMRCAGRSCVVSISNCVTSSQTGMLSSRMYNTHTHQNKTLYKLQQKQTCAAGLIVAPHAYPASMEALQTHSAHITMSIFDDVAV